MDKHSYISNSNKRFIFIKFFAFLFLTWLVSTAIYYGLNYMYMSSYGGNSGAQINHVIRTRYDAYIFGASRASHHYDTEILEDILGMSFFNAGDDGKNATYQLGLLKMLIVKHTPKLIIYEIGDLTSSLDGGTVDLYPYYYSNSDIRDILIKRDRWAKLKFLFPLYAYNRKLFSVSKGFLKASPPFTTGFRPIQGEMHPGELQRISESSRNPINTELLDPQATASFRSFVSICKENEIQLVFSFSPSFVPRSPIGMDMIQVIARDESIPIFHYGESPVFCYNPKLFKDAGHLNEEGARLFTKMFADSLTIFFNQD